MRCFLAVYPGEVARGVLADVVPDDTAELRVSDMADWHVTLRFFGELDDARIASISGVVACALHDCAPVEASLGPTTALGTGARVLFAPVKGLDGIADRIDAALDDDVDAREGPFRGHLTLARARGRTRIPGTMAGTSIHTTFLVTEVVLVGSRLEPDHAVHHAIRRFPLGSGGSS